MEVLSLNSTEISPELTMGFPPGFSMGKNQEVHTEKRKPSRS